MSAIFLLLSCKKESLTKSIALNDFNQITFNSHFEVILIQGNEHKVEFVGYEKAIEQIEYKITDSTLTLENTSNFLWANPDKNKIKVFITFKSLKKVNANESCEITNQGTLSGDELGVFFASKLNEAKLNLAYNTFYYYNNHPCGGKLTLEGTCGFLKIWNYALMQVDASALISDHVLIENHSKGDCSVNTSKLIEYSVFGEGNIYCYGNPSDLIEHNLGSKGKFILK